MDKVKIVFLDFDGVINSKETKTFSKGRILKHLVELLNPLAAHAKFIISRNWRYGSTPEQLQHFLNQHGFIGEVVGRTGILPEENRGEEIRQFLKEHGDKIDKFVIVDDIIVGMDEPLLERLARTNNDIGIVQEDVDKALKLLQ